MVCWQKQKKGGRVNNKMPGRPRACRSAKATSNGKKNRLTADFPKKGRRAGDGMLAKIKKKGGRGKSLFRSGTN